MRLYMIDKDLIQDAAFENKMSGSFERETEK